MSPDSKPTYSKYPVVGDASSVRRAFALFIDVLFGFVAYIMVSVPLWSLASDHLTFPINIAETEIVSEETSEDRGMTIKTADMQVTYFSLSGAIDRCRFQVVTVLDAAGEVQSVERDEWPLEPCAYLERFDFGTWLQVALLLFYAPLMEGGRLHATVGKAALALKVQNKNGHPIGLARAFARNLAEILCLATLGGGYLMALFTTRRQALHDLLAGTVVVER